MDTLERYLDQVCRSMGGPRELRRHVRQELREHLLDAAAEHQRSGLTAEEALNRAIAEFGNPLDMRTDLVATHGQRLLSVVIDKALNWKEKTMRAKWVWTTWATAAVLVVLALEVLFITCANLFIVPKFNKLLQDGLIDPAIIEEQGVSWMLDWLGGVNGALQYATLWVLSAAAAWGVFEWRVRSENKSWMRLSGLASVAVGLMGVVWLSSAALLISFCLGAPANGRLARQFAVAQIERMDNSLAAIEQAMPQQDWAAAAQELKQARAALASLAEEAAAIPSLKTRNEPATVDDLRQSLHSAKEALAAAGRAIAKKDAPEVAAASERYRKTTTPMREAAKRAGEQFTMGGIVPGQE